MWVVVIRGGGATPGLSVVVVVVVVVVVLLLVEEEEATPAAVLHTHTKQRDVLTTFSTGHCGEGRGHPAGCGHSRTSCWLADTQCEVGRIFLLESRS